MTDGSDEFRRAAIESMELARKTTDANARTALLIMAQKWFVLANRSAGDGWLNPVLLEFNDQRMSRH